MPLRFVVDEHFRGLFYRHIQRYNAKNDQVIDVVRVGDPSDLPLGTSDPALLRWAEREDRLLVSLDGTTLPGHLAEHLAQGFRSPGVLIIRQVSFVTVVEFLALVAHASEPD